MKTNVQKNKTFFLLFFVFSFFSFSLIAKPAETINYSDFLPTTNSSNYINASAYYDPKDFSGQSFPLITEDVPCVDINRNIGPGTRDYVVFGPILKLQMYLYQNEYMIYPPTGIYSYYTYDGVRNFQRDSGLRETGVLDMNTRTALKLMTCPVKNNINASAALNLNPNYPVFTNPINPIVTNPIDPIRYPKDPLPEKIYCPSNNTYYPTKQAFDSFCAINSYQTLYTVSFNANGADSGPAPSSQNATQGNSITLPDQGSMIKSGFTFDGWSTNSLGNGNNFSAQSNYIPSSNITLYAVWIQDSSATYTIDYEPNGADYGSPSINTQSVNVGGSLTTASMGTLMKPGYSFSGWSTSPSGTPLILSNSSYTPTSDTTLYAIWNPLGNQGSINYYTVNFNNNGGTGSPLAQNVPVGSSITLPTGAPYRSGFTFVGWSTNRYSALGSVFPGNSYFPNGDTTLYAIWR